ncbi:hypothetical protein FRC07_009421, partial [Ceratobasidium sp. 392]
MVSQQDIEVKTRFRYWIQEIKLQPNTSNYDTVIEIHVDGAKAHKLPPIKKGRQLHWAELLLPWWARDNLLETCSDDANGVSASDVHETSAITIQVTETARAYTEAFDKVQRMKKQPGIKERTGKAGDAFQVLLAIGGSIAELDPTGGAKVTFSLLTKAWECLEKEERLDANLNELLESIAGIKPSIESVKDLADNDLTRTVTAMLTLIEDVSLFVLKYKSRGSLEQAFRVTLSSILREKTEGFVDRFRRLRQDFDTQVGVQTLRAAELASTREKLRELRPVDLADYDPARSCVEGTRVDIINDILAWAGRSSAGPRFAWVHGLPGLGKSTIAASVCQRLDLESTLACSFFCKRDTPELRDPRRVLTTVLHGLAIRWEAYGKEVIGAIGKDPKLHLRHIQPLYEALVSGLLNNLAKAKPPAARLVVLVDALDECGDVTTRTQLLGCLRGMCELGDWLKVIVTSRPDLDIVQFFGHTDATWRAEYNVLNYDARSDICLFVQERLAEITPMPDGWPNDAADQLSLRSNGLFIWARTACEFIRIGVNRRERLDQVLAGTHGNGSQADLDVLYTTALTATAQGGADQNMKYTLACLGVVVVTASRTPLSVADLAWLLRGRIPRDVLHLVVDRLSSVLYFDKQTSAIRIAHYSFMDYITDSKRSKELCVGLERQNSILAECCLETMSEGLMFNICGFESSDIFNSDVPDITVRVREAIPPHLSYSCLYWSSHVAATTAGTLDAAIHDFIFGQQLLCWIEALSLLGRLTIALANLLEFVQCPVSERVQDCRAIVNDAYRFVLSFYDPISKSAPHLYISALAFAPANSMIAQRMRPRFPNLLFVTEGAEQNWTPCLRTISASSAVRSIAISSDGRRVVSGCADGAVQVWDAETGDTMLGPLQGHSAVVHSVAISPDSRWIASGADDETIRVWDAQTGDARFNPIQAHSMWVLSVGFSADGSRIVSGSMDATICVWDASTGESVLGPLHGHSHSVRSVAFSPDGKWIVSGSDDKTVQVWDANSGDAVSDPLEGHAGGILSVAFSRNGIMIASGSDDSTVRIWDATTGNPLLAPLQGHSSRVWSVGFSLDSRQVVSGSADRTVRIWDVKTGDPIRVLDGHSDWVRSVAFAPDGRRVISGSLDKTIRIWDVASGGDAGTYEESRLVKGHSGDVNSVVFSSDGRHLVSGSDDKTVCIWDAETGKLVLGPLNGHTDWVLCVAFSSDNRRVVSGSDDETVRIWNAETGDAVLEPLQGHSGSVNSVAFSPDCCLIVSGSGDTTIRIWDAETAQAVLEPLTGHTKGVSSVAFSADGLWVVSGSFDQTIRIWDVKTGQVVREPLTGHSDYVRSVAFSADGRRIVSGSDDNTVRIWDAETGDTVLGPLQGHDNWVRSVAFSPDGRWIASGSMDETVRIWDAETGEAVLEPLRGHTNRVMSVAFSPDGRRIASGFEDNTIRIWDAESHIASF